MFGPLLLRKCADCLMALLFGGVGRAVERGREEEKRYTQNEEAGDEEESE